MLTTVYIQDEARTIVALVYSHGKERGKQGWRIGYVRCRVELADDSNLLRNVAGRAMRLERGIRVVVPRTAGLLQSTPTSIRFPHCYRSRINVVFSFGEAEGRGV